MWTTWKVHPPISTKYKSSFFHTSTLKTGDCSVKTHILSFVTLRNVHLNFVVNWTLTISSHDSMLYKLLSSSKVHIYKCFECPSKDSTFLIVLCPCDQCLFSSQWHRFAGLESFHTVTTNSARQSLQACHRKLLYSQYSYLCAFPTIFLLHPQNWSVVLPSLG